MFQKGLLHQMGKTRFIQMGQEYKNDRIDSQCTFSPKFVTKSNKSKGPVKSLGMWERSKLRKMEKEAFQKEMKMRKVYHELRECTFKPELVSKQMASWRHVSPSHQTKPKYSASAADIQANLPKECKFQPVFVTKKKSRTKKIYQNKKKFKVYDRSQKYRKEKVLKERLLNPQLSNQKFVERIQSNHNYNP